MAVWALDGERVQTGDKAAFGVFKALSVVKVEGLLNTLLGLARMFSSRLRLG
jgi:hypothetical protein